MDRVIEIETIDRIEEAAEKFLATKGDRRVIAFYGEMGAGKTTFIKTLCKVLGVVDVVISPTFTLINEYRRFSGESVYHFDFYRIDKITEALDIGFEEFVYGRELCLIEWPEKIEELLPSDTLKVRISVLDSGRRELRF